MLCVVLQDTMSVEDLEFTVNELMVMSETMCDRIIVEHIKENQKGAQI